MLEAIRSGDTAAIALVLQGSRTAVTPPGTGSPPSPTFTSSLQPNGTPLHLAAAFAPKNVLEFLLKPPYKFNVDAIDMLGNTALHLAARAGRCSIVHLLLAHGADDSICNNDGKDARDITMSAEIRAAIDGVLLA